MSEVVAQRGGVTVVRNERGQLRIAGGQDRIRAAFGLAPDVHLPGTGTRTIAGVKSHFIVPEQVAKNVLGGSVGSQAVADAALGRSSSPLSIGRATLTPLLLIAAAVAAFALAFFVGGDD